MTDESHSVRASPVDTIASGVPRTPCRHCGGLADVAAKFCPHCGRRISTGEAWYYRPLWIVVLALFVLGPIALILVWKSPKMGRTAKLVMMAVILAYTAYCGYFMYRMTALEMRELDTLNRILQQVR